MTAHRNLESIGHPTPQGLDERTKIQYFTNGIKPTANLETALAVCSTHPTYENNFTEFVNYISSEIERSKTRLQSNKDTHGRRNVNQLNTSRRRGRGRGRGNSPQTPVNNNNKGIGKFVDGKWITNKYYPNFRDLTPAQKT